MKKKNKGYHLTVANTLVCESKKGYKMINSKLGKIRQINLKDLFQKDRDFYLKWSTETIKVVSSVLLKKRHKVIPGQNSLFDFVRLPFDSVDEK